MDYVKWILEQHEAINHQYDKYLPYEFHLRIAARVYDKFKHLLDDKEPFYQFSDRVWTERSVCYLATWGHDLLEDVSSRVSYNDLKNQICQEVADVVYGVTNEKGKIRTEKANDKYYREMVEQKGSVFVKLCDRIANLQYGRLSGSSMYGKYQKEMPNFISKIYTPRFDEMFEFMKSV